MPYLGLALAALILLPTNLLADGFEGCRDAELLSNGVETEDPFLAGICLGTIQGMRDMATIQRVETGTSSVCVPKTLRTIQLAMNFNRSADRYRGLDFSLAVGTFLMEEYPCQ